MAVNFSQFPSLGVAGVNGVQPAAVVAGSAAGAGGSVAPAFSWLGMVALLVLIRVLWEMAERRDV